MRKIFLMGVLALVVCMVLSPCGSSAAGIPYSQVVQIDVRGSYLHSNSGLAYWAAGNSWGMDSPSPPMVIDLEQEGLIPGDLLAMEYYGSVAYHCPGQQFQFPFSVMGVFSSSTQLLPQGERYRVPGATSSVTGGGLSSPTLFGSEPTDIPEDFRIYPPAPTSWNPGGFQIRIPIGARYLFLAINDSYYSDNCGDVAVTITRVVPPSISANTSQAVLWPPNGKLVPVEVSGTITRGSYLLNPQSAGYRVIDEYQQLQPNGPITIDSNGHFRLVVNLEARRDGQDLDGRKYTIIVTAIDVLGHAGGLALTVTVPHDLGLGGTPAN